MEPGILKLSEQERRDIEAHAVKIGIVVEGENFLYGNAALEKCQEVRQAVERIQAVEPGIAIHVQSVQVRSDSGWFSKSSKGVYSLEMTLEPLDRINEVLGVLMDLKNVNLHSLTWVFLDDEIKIELAAQAMAKALKKAEAMATAVGHRVIGIRACSDSYQMPQLDMTVLQPLSADGALPASVSRVRLSKAPTADLGTPMNGKKEIVALVSVEFFIQATAST